MKEKIGIYYDTSEPLNYFNEIFTIQFFNSMYTIVLTTAYKPDPSSKMTAHSKHYRKL
jgi:hypothetical protein